MALTPFEQEFKSQRESLGPGKTFTFKGKEYSTDYAKPKTESNRGGARMKSGVDVMDTLPKVGKVKTGEIAPISDRAEVSGGSGDYMSKVSPKQTNQTKGFKAEDMGMNQYKKPELNDFIPTKKAIPGRLDKPMSSLPGRSPNKEQYRKAQEDYQSDLVGKMAMKKGGLVTAKRTSHRGAGIAVKGFGRAGGR